jgi:predicted Zn finger-like uncharacterized protein
MIIDCVNCSKKFNVNSELIPDQGRQVKCSSCNHNWHFKKGNSLEKLTNISNKVANQEPSSNEITFEQDESKPILNATKLPVILENNTRDNTKINSNQSNKKHSKKINNLFSYLIVFIISFVSLIILMDTLKTPLINLFPGIEIILFNLFETLKDIKSFIIDLI